MKSELRFTDTNAASDSKGRTWGLEGNLFWWLIAGIGVAITAFFLLLVAFKLSLVASLGLALIPILLCLGYIFGFRHGKPPGFDSDFLEFCLTGRGFGEPSASGHVHPIHPPQI
jgi:hypothetical protein